MKREYQKPAMTVVQLQQRTMLLTGSSKEVQSLDSSSSGLNYRGSDADYDEDAR